MVTKHVPHAEQRFSVADVTDKMTDLQITIFNRIRSCGWNGCTTDELEAFTHRTHQSVSARVNELAKLKHIERRAAKRKTRAGRGAFIYVQTGLKASNKEES